MYSTTGDLHRWYQSLMSGRVLSAESIARLLRPSVTISEGSSALGWFIGKSPNGRKRIFTRGNEDFGANALFYVYPERDTEIIVLTHAGNANKQLSWSRFLHARLERLLGL